MSTTTEYIPAGDNAPVIDSGAAAAQFWRERVMTLPQFRPEAEWTATLLLDAGRKLIGHLAAESNGQRGQVTMPKGKILRSAMLSNAAGVVLMHNHPPGSPIEPSDDDRHGLATLLNCLEVLELPATADSVIVDEKGGQFYSFAEAGEIRLRAEVKEEAKWKTREEGLTLALECLEAHDPRVTPIVNELSAASGVSREQWFADWSYGAFVRHFSPSAVEDRRLCLLGAIHARSFKAFKAMDEAARQAGTPASEFMWQEAVDVTVKKWEPPARNERNPPPDL